MIRYKHFEEFKKVFNRYKSFEFRHTGTDYLYLVKEDFTIKLKHFELVEIEFKDSIILKFKFLYFYDIKDKIEILRKCIKLVNSIIEIKKLTTF